MEKTFVFDNVEYKIVRNPSSKALMIARVDGLQIENRKDVCRRFLRTYGWDNDMFRNKTTNDLERQINKIINDSNSEEVNKTNPPQKTIVESDAHCSSTNSKN